ncbi:hypothetical protein ACH4OV_25325 [Streptomyces diastaticus]|uniref:hypothetical protein n=1 Tax=Streptomyces diastaticus TaxID=1956 RepID=UPI0037B13CE9
MFDFCPGDCDAPFPDEPGDLVMEAAGEFAKVLGHVGNIEWPAVKALFRLLDVHAHELAEEIREAARGSYPSGLCPAVSTAKGAADLIDPDVQTPAYVMTDIARSRVVWNLAAHIDEEDTA